MVHLFSPLTIGVHRIRNRIVRAPLPLDHQQRGGFVAAHQVARYASWAKGGVGLILSEPLHVLDLPDIQAAGIYSDVLIPDLRRIRAAVGNQTVFLPVLAYPALMHDLFNQVNPARVLELYESAVWRAAAAGFTGVMLDAGPHSLLHQSISSRFNQRGDQYGSEQRIRFAESLVERLRARFGPQFLLGYRMVVDELRPDGITLQTSRVMARRLSAAGVNLFDMLVGDEPATPVAQFPGWQIPLAESLRSVLDVPLILNDDWSDPFFANEMIAEGSADLIALGRPLMINPQWPLMAAKSLHQAQAAS